MHLADWLNDAVAFIVITDPVGLIPIFLGLTMGMTAAEQRQAASLSSLIAFAVIALFMLIGKELLAALAISIGAFWLAGGILLFFIAFDMIFGKEPERKSKAVESAAMRARIRNIAAFPLALPMMAGPGVLSAAILMSSKYSSLAGLGLSLIAAAASVGICYIFMLAAGPLDRLIGNAGRSILAKIFGILLAAMAVQFASDGIHALFLK